MSAAAMPRPSAIPPAATTGMLVPIVSMVLLPVVMALVQHYVIAREEQYLERKFGEEYLRYKGGARRWV